MIKGVRVDAVITDPPYNVGKDYGNSVNDKRKDYEKWCMGWFRELRKICKLIVFTPGMVNMRMWLKRTEPRWVCAWFKPNSCSFSRLGGASVWEPVLVYGKPKKRIGTDAWKVPIKIRKETEFHPCPKNIDFWKILIDKFTEEGDLVLDPFIGSGTTAVACKHLNRSYIGFDINPEYIKKAEERLKNHCLLQKWL